mgnify:CR=1 FL=1
MGIKRCDEWLARCRQIHRMEGRDNEHRDGGNVLFLLDTVVEFATVHTGAAEVLDDEIDGLGLQNHERFLATCYLDAFVASAHKDNSQKLAHAFVIIHTQNFFHHLYPLARWTS